MNLPLLSVIVPIYNVEEYLPECIESIINQSYKNLEIILVDDGSKGKEPEICDNFAHIDSRIHVIHQKNSGLVSARKAGIFAAHGEYITFVDGDDYISTDYYEKMIAHIQKTDSVPDIICSSIMQVPQNSVSYPVLQNISSGIYTGDDLIHFYQNMNCFEEKFYTWAISPSVSTKLFRTEIIKLLAPSVPEIICLGEDAAFTYPSLLNSNTIIVDNNITGYNYRIIPTSMSRAIDSSIFYKLSGLYSFLKPYYYNTTDKLIINQLEYYRACLLSYSLSLWESNYRLGNIRKKARI